VFQILKGIFTCLKSAAVAAYFSSYHSWIGNSENRLKKRCRNVSVGVVSIVSISQDSLKCCNLYITLIKISRVLPDSEMLLLLLIFVLYDLLSFVSLAIKCVLLTTTKKRSKRFEILNESGIE
jgi:hypothetical protein